MKLDFAKVRTSLFSGKLTQSQVDGLNAIMQAINDFKLQDKRQAAYILATAYHETAKTMQPITEYGSDAYLRGKKYWPYIGRGYVQLTWEDNYRKMSTLTGFNLVKNPDYAKRPAVAAKIMMHGMTKGLFTGKRLSDYINSIKCDYKGARRIINGTDRASDIAEYAERFDDALSY